MVYDVKTKNYANTLIIVCVYTCIYFQSLTKSLNLTTFGMKVTQLGTTTANFQHFIIQTLHYFRLSTLQPDICYLSQHRCHVSPTQSQHQDHSYKVQPQCNRQGLWPRVRITVLLSHVCDLPVNKSAHLTLYNM